MTPRRIPTPVLVLLTALPFLLAPATGRAEPKMLQDSTFVEEWKLPNGLRVTTHHIPGAAAVAITVGVPVGTDADPAGREGLARLAAEVQMMAAAAGGVPERTREEMASLRPLGWSIKVTRRFTQLAEVATRDQFPGVLRQAAGRLRGVTVSEGVLRAAVATVRKDIGSELFGPPEQALYYQVRQYATGHDATSIVSLAAAKSLEAVRARDLEARLHREFVPAHAVLAIAGDLEGINLHALVENEFGALPAGDPLPPAPAVTLAPSSQRLVRAEVDHPVGVIGVIAPALTDSLHPQFFLSLLIMGQHLKDSWPPDGTIRSRFTYSILDEPDLVRIYPRVPADSTEPSSLSLELEGTLSSLVEMIVDSRSYYQMIYSVAWLLGGPMPDNVIDGVRRDGSALNYVCNAMATRELTGGEAFWSVYRDHFDLRRNPQLPGWAGYLANRRNQVRLMMVPRGR